MRSHHRGHGHHAPWEHRGWGGHDGPRPPWWPTEGMDRHDWHRMRRRFLRRAVFGFLGVLTLLVSVNAVAVIVARRLAGDDGGPAIIVTVGLFLVVTLVAAARTVRRLAAPVGELMEAADRVADGDYDVRVTPRGPGEVRRLGEAFNAMAERLASNDTQRRQLLADVAHELRTPLSVVQANVEGILDGVYGADGPTLGLILDETALIVRLLDDLRTLSTSEAGALVLHREPADLGALVTDAAAAFAGQADERGVDLVVSAPATPVEVDAARISQVLHNLVANALDHTPTGGQVTVTADATPDHARVTVTDTGPGIPDDLLPHVFDRFVRGEGSRGTGLGLAIARNLVEAHGGGIRATNAVPTGTRVSFTLPA